MDLTMENTLLFSKNIQEKPLASSLCGRVIKHPILHIRNSLGAKYQLKLDS